ncbi:amidase [Nocardioides zeae]|uniref:Amidase n=2 Tax=Nocardioides zeae TaxID=1457234 RepID=A0AAJ1U958_9ACTN|nr:amidase [Nocardioides zeae]MDQ1106412.1 amidase [Nocardioides zeae]MDR6173902.1 amidase [Nocardioides zeae]MDR6211542.1 amidase [Nocardioides zeae]
MSLTPPTRGDVERIAGASGLGIAETDLDTYHGAATGLLQSWNVVEELYAEIAPTAPAREWTRPRDEENPFGAWYVTTEITGAADGPLAGLRVAVKDNTAVGGVPMMNGSRMLEGFVPRQDATTVARLLDAGATIAGKAVCEDLCFSGGSHTAKSGPVRNPWDETRSTAGSSSGSAALVASGIVDAALGCDQGGSIRLPAAWCGVVGHKPTWGLVPYTGAFPIEQTIDQIGPITRTTRDAARVLTAIAGVDGVDPRQPDVIEAVDYVAALDEPVAGLRIGIVTEGFGLASSEPEVDAAVRDAIATLEGAGLVAEEVSIPWHSHGAALWDVISVEGATYQMVDGNGYGLNWKGLYDPDQMEFYGRTWRQDPSAFSETVKLVLLAGRHALETSHGTHYAMARNLEPQLAAAYDAALERFDVLVMPTTPMRPTVIPDADAPVADVLGRALEMLTNTAAFDVTGHPACSVPAGLVDGLPVGLQIIGKKFDDATVLRVAQALETAVGGFPLPTSVRSNA